MEGEGEVEAQQANLSNLSHDVGGSIQQNITAGNAVRQQAPKKRSAFQLRARIHHHHFKFLPFLQIKVQQMKCGQPLSADAARW